MKLYDILTKYKDSEKIAISSNSEDITYNQLYKRALAFSGMIERREDSDNIIAIYLPNNADYVISYFAVLMAGCTLFPINISTKQDELIADYNICQFTYLITDAQNYKKLPDKLINESELRIFVMEEINNIEQNRSISYKTDDSKNNVALLINTSGTTSNSKFVMLSHENLFSTVDAYVSTGRLNEDVRLLHIIPFSSSYGNMVLLGILAAKATIVFAGNLLSHKHFCEIVQEKKITHFECVSSFLYVISQNDNISQYDLSSLKHIGFGGDSASKDVVKKLLKLYSNAKLSQGYGLSEAAPLITRFDPDISRQDEGKFLNKITSAGTAVKDVQIKLDTLPEGEILVIGPNVMLGYYKNQEETNKVLHDGYLHTGDIGYIDDEGFLYIRGRKKNIIIVGGHNVFPEEIEAVLCNYKSVKSAYVYGAENERMGQQIECKIEVDSDFYSTDVELKKYCDQYLPIYKIPTNIYIVDSITRNKTGKIKRH